MERRRRVKLHNYNEDDDDVSRDKPVRKKSLLSVLTKILTSLKQKDTFGFFLTPVDVNSVPDYLTFISQPMDFSTMTNKLPEYSSISEFQADFDLIISNAKKYNAPSTVYYKEAHKLGVYGFPLIEREAKSVATSQELQDILNESQKRKTEMTLRKRVAQGKKNHQESLEELILGLYNGDGTYRRKDLEKEELFRSCKFQKFIDSYSVDYFNSVLAPSENRLAELYGWTAPKPTDLQCASKIEASFLYHTYGNKRGYTYASSLEQFAADVPFLKNKIEQFLSEITEDSHQIVKKVQEVMKLDKSERDKVEKEARVVQTKKGRLDVIGRLNEIEYQVQKILDNSFMENIKRDASDIAPLLKPISSTIDGSFQASLTTASHQSVLDENLKDLELFVKSAESEEDTNKKLAILEKIRRRLVHLVSVSPPSEFGGPPSQSMLAASRGFSGNRAIPSFSKKAVDQPSTSQNTVNMPSLNLTQLQQMQQMRSAMRAGGVPYARPGMNVGAINNSQVMSSSQIRHPSQGMNPSNMINLSQMMNNSQMANPQIINPVQGINPAQILGRPPQSSIFPSNYNFQPNTKKE